MVFYQDVGCLQRPGIYNSTGKEKTGCSGMTVA